MTGKIKLNGMQFYAYHGCLESERREGNRFSVDLECGYSVASAAESDNLSDAVDYARIYDIVKAEMAIPSNLLENVAWRILAKVRGHFPAISEAIVTVTKFNPPLDGDVESSSVTLKI
jgi:dihydroneopterin aldolase